MCGRYFTGLNTGSFDNWSLHKAGTSMLYILVSWFWFHHVIDQWLKKIPCVKYITKFVLGSNGNRPVIIAESLCSLF